MDIKYAGGGSKPILRTGKVQLTTSSRRQNGGAYCGATVGGKRMVSNAKLVIYEFAI